MPTAHLVAWDRDPETIKQWPHHEDPQTTKESESEELRAEIERARGILELPEDWDGEGSPSYLAATFDRAVGFLKTHSEYLMTNFDLEIPVPRIGAGPDGSIDLHWKRTSWELLVNIPADSSKMASFYGDNYGVQQIKGSVDSEICNLGLAAWLMN